MLDVGMARSISAVEARRHLGALLDDVSLSGAEYIIERAGKPVAAIIPLDAYEEYQQARGGADQQLDRSRGRQVQGIVADEIEVRVAAVAQRTGLAEDEVRRVLAIVDAALAVGWQPARQGRPLAETIKEQYERVPDVGQPFPGWADQLLDDVGVAPEQRGYARDLLKRVMVTVGFDQAAVTAFLYDPNDILRQSPIEAIREHGWGALDALLRTMFVGPMP